MFGIKFTGLRVGRVRVNRRSVSLPLPGPFRITLPYLSRKRRPRRS